MTAAVFVDTNVFVYALDTSETVKQPAAARWIEPSPSPASSNPV